VKALPYILAVLLGLLCLAALMGGGTAALSAACLALGLRGAGLDFASNLQVMSDVALDLANLAALCLLVLEVSGFLLFRVVVGLPRWSRRIAAWQAGAPT
jgi:hypothetical protein